MTFFALEMTKCYMPPPGAILFLSVRWSGSNKTKKKYLFLCDLFFPYTVKVRWVQKPILKVCVMVVSRDQYEPPIYLPSLHLPLPRAPLLIHCLSLSHSLSTQCAPPHHHHTDLLIQIETFASHLMSISLTCYNIE